MNATDEIERGYYLVCPDLNYARIGWADALARLLNYLIARIGEIIAVPEGVRFEIIPLRWHHFGNAYPSIGIPAHAETTREESRKRDDYSYEVADAIDKYIQRVGLERLIELSADEPIIWQEVKDRYLDREG